MYAAFLNIRDQSGNIQIFVSKKNIGIDKAHYPEFTLFECYMAYVDYNDMMDLMENLFELIQVSF
ncbi:hypothetical protein KTC96_23885 (plasmid) [Clostridium estertheticum]|uniref:amino acid--tRNA ligase-related protein n=1 Tax=Clostridium estertheticum TaxID=238834 RepID=UPI001C7D6302|nr:amino acid--tRNA ligase-related protein [Clostridium estertheticum]MBX4262187.1 hypothetical protein [Clostridium estertheticum]WLC73172.1 hypothetical protein KTC96_23885 [Clostridium estertheticum]